MNKVTILLSSFILASIFCFGQTSTIASLNKILAQCQSTVTGTTKYGVKATYVQNNFKLKINPEKTKLIYSWDVINTSTNKKSESYYYEAKLSDIDFDNIKVYPNKDNSCLITIDQVKSSNKTFILHCSGENCYNPTEYSNNFGIEFSPVNCAKYHEEFLDLFKKLKP